MQREQSNAPRHDGARDENAKRDRALAPYDAHPGIAVVLLAVMALLVVAVAYQFFTDRTDHPTVAGRSEMDSTKTLLRH